MGWGIKVYANHNFEQVILIIMTCSIPSIMYCSESIKIYFFSQYCLLLIELDTDQNLISFFTPFAKANSITPAGISKGAIYIQSNDCFFSCCPMCPTSIQRGRDGDNSVVARLPHKSHLSLEFLITLQHCQLSVSHHIM